MRLDVEERTNLRHSPGADYVTPAIAAVEAHLDTTHNTVIDIQREVLRATPGKR